MIFSNFNCGLTFNLWPFQVRSTNKNMELRDGDQRGLLWLLDEEAIFPGSSDDSFVERLFLHHGDKQERRKLKDT